MIPTRYSYRTCATKISIKAYQEAVLEAGEATITQFNGSFWIAHGQKAKTTKVCVAEEITKYPGFIKEFISNSDYCV